MSDRATVESSEALDHTDRGDATTNGVGAPIVPIARAVAPDPVAGRASMPQWLTKLYIIGTDVATVLVAATLANVGRDLLPASGDQQEGIKQIHLVALVLPGWVAMFAYYRLYSARFITTRLEEFRRTIHAIGASVAGSALVAFMLAWPVARAWLVLWFLLAVPLVAFERELVRRAFERLRRSGRLRRSCLIVGANAEGAAICEMLIDELGHGYEIVGFLDNRRRVGSVVCAEVPVVGRVADTLDLALSMGVSSVIVVTTAVETATTNELARRLTDAGVHVELSSSLADIAAGRLTVRPLGRFPVIYVEPVHRHGWRAGAKRVFDVVGAAGTLLALSPVLLAIALAIRIDTPGTVFFKQQRVGKDARLFKVWKFRTMSADAEDRLAEVRHLNEVQGPLFKIVADPRVTRVGRVLRKLSLDEFPQLINVLRGEMSLVGPRPALPSEMREWAPPLHDRLRVRPGLTGMWQVSGRSDSSFEEYVRLDLYYVDNWSFWTDLGIVAKTIPTVLLRRGAY